MPAILGLINWPVRLHLLYDGRYEVDVHDRPFLGSSGNPPFGEIIFVLFGTLELDMPSSFRLTRLMLIKGMIREGFAYSPPNLLAAG